MNNLIVAYGSKWNNENIVEILLNDKGKNTIFTLIEYEKYFEIIKLIDKRNLSLKIIEYDLSTILYKKEIILNENEIIYDCQLKIILSKTAIKNLQYAESNNLGNIKIGLYSAGMSEIDIVTIGYIYLKLLNYDVYPKIDLGVNNLKKTKSVFEEINKMDIIITTAGMEAILPTVLAHITYKPIIAVPSNVSYGYGANGIAGIYSILMSDAPGIATFNIGNIYGACIFAHKIGKYLTKRQCMSNIQAKNLFEPKYSKSITFANSAKTIKLRDKNNVMDTINGIRINYPIINLNNKDEDQINNFINNHQYVILRDNRINKNGFKIPNNFKKYNEIIFSNASMEFIMNREKVYDNSKNVLVICGGMSDLKYAKEFEAYMKLNNLKCDIIESFDMNQIILYEDQLNDLKNDYHVCIVFASMNGTISNLVGGFLEDIPVIAVPVGNSLTEVHDERNTLMSMLNNCVGGIAVVEKNNIYSAACLVLSILFNFQGDINELSI